MGKILNEHDIYKIVEEFNDEYFPGWRDTELIFYSNALAGEAGEVCNAVKKLYGGGTKSSNITMSKVYEEMADVVIYLTLIKLKYNIIPEEFNQIIKEKMDVNIERMEERRRNNE